MDLAGFLICGKTQGKGEESKKVKSLWESRSQDQE
jgi:hypothetical protein